MFPALSTSLKATIIQSCFHTTTPRDAQTCQRSHLNFSHSYSSPYTGLQVHSWCIYLSPPIWVSSKTSHRPRTSSDRALTLVWMEPPQACAERRSTLTKGDKQDKFAQRAPALQRWSGLLAHAKPAHRPLRKKSPSTSPPISCIKAGYDIKNNPRQQNKMMLLLSADSQALESSSYTKLGKKTNTTEQARTMENKPLPVQCTVPNI